jgi:hypothetical protein
MIRNKPDDVEWSAERTSSLHSCNRFMLDLADNCDVTLLVKRPKDQTETKIPAHRYVLCSRSSEFYRLLWFGKAMNEKKLKVADTSADVMKQLIRYVTRTLLCSLYAVKKFVSYYLNILECDSAVWERMWTVSRMIDLT